MHTQKRLEPYANEIGAETKVAPIRCGSETQESLEDAFWASRQRFVRLAYSILRNKEDAEDAVQDAFISACRRLSSFEGRSAFLTWFTRIVINAALMIRRKRKLSRVDFDPELQFKDTISWTDRIVSQELNPEATCRNEETNRLIADALRKLKPNLRDALVLTYYDEFSPKDACAFVGVPLATYKARILRARHSLRTHIRRALIPRGPTSRSGNFPTVLTRL